MTGRRAKLLLILFGLVLAGIVLASWTQTWFTFDLGTGYSVRTVTADGSVVAPALTALALAQLVLLGAIAIAGRFFRVALAVIQVLVGVAIIFSAVTALSDPAQAANTAITKATAVAGHTSIETIAASSSATAWPVVTIVVGALLIVAAIGILVTARSWPSSASRKYTRVAPAEGERTSVDDWDSLSGGDDPTS